MLSHARVVDKKHYVVIKQALSADACELLATYAHFKANVKAISNRSRSSDPLKDIHREYGDRMIEALVETVTPLVERATGRELWPTLSFYYTYKNGNQLKKHKDRSSCQLVAGLYIGADDDYKTSHASWPLYLNVEGQPEAVALDVGDLVIFNGHETEHWREPFTGTWFVSAIFGFVDKQGPFAFQKYDQRVSLGKPHIGMFRWLYGCIKQKIRGLLISSHGL